MVGPAEIQAPEPEQEETSVPNLELVPPFQEATQAQKDAAWSEAVKRGYAAAAESERQERGQKPEIE